MERKSLGVVQKLILLSGLTSSITSVGTNLGSSVGSAFTCKAQGCEYDAPPWAQIVLEINIACTCHPPRRTLSREHCVSGFQYTLKNPVQLPRAINQFL